MIREEAKGYLTDLKYLKFVPDNLADEALDMAIKILNQDPCTDAISRQAVLILPRKIMKNYFGEIIDEVISVKDIQALPPVTPEEKVGHWVDDNDGHGTSCSECDKWYPHSYIAKREIIYCCRCGAKMQESEGSDADCN